MCEKVSWLNRPFSFSLLPSMSILCNTLLYSELTLSALGRTLLCNYKFELTMHIVPWKHFSNNNFY